jgi:hypothetical protein
MTIKELEVRLEALETAVRDLQKRVNGTSTGPNPVAWWTPEGGAGRFANDPGFEEMCRLGREYRESLHPDRKKRKRKRARVKKHARA